jgi:hypothetical protein
MANIFKVKKLLGISGNFSDKVLAPNLIYNTGNQLISGLKTFVSRPAVNGTGVLLSGEAYLNSNPSGFITNQEYYFTGDLIVSLSNNKTFGRYGNGEIVPASGKTPSEVIKLALVEPIAPTVTLTSSTTILFNQTSINNILNASHIINSLNSSIQTGYIEWRRGNVGDWSQITGTLSSSFSFTHSITDSNFNTSGFNYRYIVVDTIQATNTGSLNINPQSYSAPTLSSTNVGSTTALLGSAKNTNLSATINRQSSLVSLTGYQLQYSTGTPTNWINIGERSGIIGNPSSFNFSIPHINNNLVNATNISYQTIIYDTFTNTPRSLGSRSFLYGNYFGYNTGTSLTGVNQIEALVSETLSNNKNRSITGTTPDLQHFTYYAYRSGAGEISTIVQDGSTTIYNNGVGAFTEQSSITGLNKSGANVAYRVYKSNDPGAFSNNLLTFN